VAASTRQYWLSGQYAQWQPLPESIGSLATKHSGSLYQTALTLWQVSTVATSTRQYWLSGQ